MANENNNNEQIQTQTGSVAENNIPEVTVTNVTPVAAVDDLHNNLNTETTTTDPNAAATTPATTTPATTTTTQPATVTNLTDSLLNQIDVTRNAGNNLINTYQNDASKATIDSLAKALKEKLEADETLVNHQYTQDLENAKAEKDANNEYISSLTQSLAKSTTLLEWLGAKSEQDAIKTEAYYTQAVAKREEQKAQQLQNYQQYLAESARLSGYGVGSNLAAYVAGKMLSFTSQYDLQTNEVFEKGMTLSKSLREERSGFGLKIDSLVREYAQQKKEAYINAKKAENTINYMVEWESSWKKSKINELRQVAQAQLLTLDTQLKENVEKAYKVSSEMLKQEIENKATIEKSLKSEFTSMMEKGNMFAESDAKLERFSQITGLTPNVMRDIQLRESVLPKVMKLVSAGKLDANKLMEYQAEVAGLMKSGLPLTEALYQFAKNHNIEWAFTENVSTIIGTSNGVTVWGGNNAVYFTGKNREEVVQYYMANKDKYADYSSYKEVVNKDGTFSIIVAKTKEDLENATAGSTSLFGNKDTSTTGTPVTVFNSNGGAGLSGGFTIEKPSEAQNNTTTTTTTTTENKENTPKVENKEEEKNEMKTSDNLIPGYKVENMSVEQEKYTKDRYKYDFRGTGFISGLNATKFATEFYYTFWTWNQYDKIPEENLKKLKSKIINIAPAIPATEQTTAEEKRNALVEYYGSQYAVVYRDALVDVIEKNGSLLKKWEPLVDFQQAMSKHFNSKYVSQLEAIRNQFSQAYQQADWWSDGVYDFGIGLTGDIDNLLFNEAMMKLK